VNSTLASLLGPVKEWNKKQLYFQEGLPGLKQYHCYELKRIKENIFFYLLQSQDNPKVRLLLADPYPFFPDYRINFSKNHLKDLQAVSLSQIAVFVVVTSFKERFYVNLAAPIAVNASNKRGKQLVFTDQIRLLRQQLKIPVVRRK
jgi:flagellar assembly factor FliW